MNEKTGTINNSNRKYYIDDYINGPFVYIKSLKGGWWYLQQMTPAGFRSAVSSVRQASDIPGERNKTIHVLQAVKYFMLSNVYEDTAELDHVIDALIDASGGVVDPLFVAEPRNSAGTPPKPTYWSFYKAKAAAAYRLSPTSGNLKILKSASEKLGVSQNTIKNLSYNISKGAIKDPRIVQYFRYNIQQGMDVTDGDSEKRQAFAEFLVGDIPQFR